MRKKPKVKLCSEKRESKQYTVRFFNSVWEEAGSLRQKCSEADAMIELALWLRSRQTSDPDEQVIVLSVYASYPFISIESGSENHESEET